MIGRAELPTFLRLLGLFCLTCLLVLLDSLPVNAATLRVAVSSNFADAARSLVKEYEANSEHQVILLVGSTGKHYAQIQNGLVVDVFLAADRARPELLEANKKGIAGTRFTYAVGRLVLWSASGQVDETTLAKVQLERIAIANPKIAPYGLAAEQSVAAMGLMPALAKNFVHGENVAQAFQFVTTKNARYGFVALAQVKARHENYWLVPASLHDLIEQQAILVRDSDAGRSLLAFLRSDKAKKLIQQHGYDTP